MSARILREDAVVALNTGSSSFSWSEMSPAPYVTVILWEDADQGPVDPDYDPALDVLGWDDVPLYSARDRSDAAQGARADAVRSESYRRQALGTYGAFTDEEMAEARGLAARNVRPDPVQEILGHAGDWMEGDEREERHVVGLMSVGHSVSVIRGHSVREVRSGHQPHLPDDLLRHPADR